MIGLPSLQAMDRAQGARIWMASEATDMRSVSRWCRASPNRLLAASSKLESHGRQAAEYLKENRPRSGGREFRAIVALDPNNVDARGNLGVRARTSKGSTRMRFRSSAPR